VQFTVKVHKGKHLSIPRLVNDEYLISIASQPEFQSSMDFGLREANADMLKWLTTEYKLTAPEANLLSRYGGTAQDRDVLRHHGHADTAQIPRQAVRDHRGNLIDDAAAPLGTPV